MSLGTPIIQDPATIQPSFPEEKFSACHCYDVITTVVVPILLAIAVSLAIYYAVHPIKPLVPLYGGFSLSLPLLICGGTGLTLTLVLIVQIIRRAKVKMACGHCIGHHVHTDPRIQQKVRTLLHVGGRPERQTTDHYRAENVQSIRAACHYVGPAVSFDTRDGLMLKGYWHQSRVPSAPTVIFFYGNLMTADNVSEMGRMYRKMGCNILIVEYRGYGLSEGVAAGPNAELEAYYDAEAALKFIHSQNIDRNKIVAHGFSLGGAYAAALGYFFKVPYVILQQTFTHSAAVASHVSKVVPAEMIAPAIAASYSTGSARPLPEFPDGLPLQTDGFDTLAKVRKMRCTLLVIRATEDHLMPMEFGEQLVQARYTDAAEQATHLITWPGEHNLNYLLEHPDAQLQLQNLFQQEYLLQRAYHG